MTLSGVMAELKSLGTAQNRKIYARHGFGDNQFGVSFANLGKIQKRIKRDHALALALWDTGNGDARSLAAMIADPAAMTGAQLESWVAGIANYTHADLFARYVAGKSPLAAKKSAKWIASKKDFISQTGWVLIATLAAGADESELHARLRQIEAGIATAGNRTRHAMNSALISIGLRGGALETEALAAAARIGKVDVDHGETGCVTPDAAAYIRKTKAYRAAKKKTRAS